MNDLYFRHPFHTNEFFAVSRIGQDHRPTIPRSLVVEHSRHGVGPLNGYVFNLLNLDCEGRRDQREAFA